MLEAFYEIDNPGTDFFLSVSCSSHALEPFIDAKTIEIRTHHHQAYMAGLNAVLMDQL